MLICQKLLIELLLSRVLSALLGKRGLKGSCLRQHSMKWGILWKIRICLIKVVHPLVVWRLRLKMCLSVLLGLLHVRLPLLKAILRVIVHFLLSLSVELPLRSVSRCMLILSIIVFARPLRLDLVPPLVSLLLLVSFPCPLARIWLPLLLRFRQQDCGFRRHRWPISIRWRHLLAFSRGRRLPLRI